MYLSLERNLTSEELLSFLGTKSSEFSDIPVLGGKRKQFARHNTSLAAFVRFTAFCDRSRL